jgi:hypothetical protein
MTHLNPRQAFMMFSDLVEEVIEFLMTCAGFSMEIGDADPVRGFQPVIVKQIELAAIEDGLSA